MFHLIVAGTIFGSITIVSVFFAYLNHNYQITQRMKQNHNYLPNSDNPFRYLTPRRVRKRLIQLKVAELDNKIEFENLKRDELLALRQGATSHEEVTVRVNKGRELTR